MQFLSISLHHSVLISTMVLYLLCVLCAVFFIAVPHSAAAQSTPWNLHSYIWNERLDVWARTTCDMPISNVSSSSTPIQGCSNTATLPATTCNIGVCDDSVVWKNAVKYYHDGYDANADGDFDDSSDIKTGEIRGHAWSPVYGAIYFDLDKFPADDSTTTGIDEGSCYGLTGANRQARIVRVNAGSNGVDKDDHIIPNVPDGGTTAGTTVTVVGCAYAPLLRDFILLGPASPFIVGGDGRTVTSSSVPSGWKGVRPFVREIPTDVNNPTPGTGCTNQYCAGITFPYMQLFGCGWSQKSGDWSFGPNFGSTTDVNNCLPSGHNTGFSNAVDIPSLGFKSNVAPQAAIAPSSRTARIGQRIILNIFCPLGRSKAQWVSLGSPPPRTVSANKLSPGSGGSNTVGYSYFETLFSPISQFRLRCTDRHVHKIFGDINAEDSRGISVKSLVLRLFRISPAVLTEGGLVDFEVSIDNFTSPDSNNAFCKIAERLTNRVASCFKTNFLTTSTVGSTTHNDAVVRDTEYELRCWYQSPPRPTATDPNPTNTNRTEADLCNGAVDTSSWNEVGPISAAVRVLPERAVDRNVAKTIPVPDVSLKLDMSTSRDPTKDKIVVAVPSHAKSGTNAPYYFEVNIYAVDSSNNNKFITLSSPNRFFHFMDTDTFLKRNDITCAGGGTTCAAAAEKINNKDSHIILDNLKTEILRTSFQNKVLIVQMRTDDGVRSQKVIFDPNPNAPFGGCGGETLRTQLYHDCETLLAAKDTLVGTGRTALNSWSRTESIASWNGVNVRSGSLVWIRKNGGLKGQIPESLGRLKTLTEIDLSGNTLTGEIPASLGRLPSLLTLKLQNNKLGGCIPVSIQQNTGITTKSISSQKDSVTLSPCS